MYPLPLDKVMADTPTALCVLGNGVTGMDAPSERHLEDYLWGHPEALGVLDYPPELADVPIYKLVYRQFQVPSGIVDLVGFDWRLCCFELKKGPVTSKALTQLLRYMEDMKNCLICFVMHRGVGNKVMQAWMRSMGYPDASELSLMTGVLIGNSLEDENLLIAADLLDIEVFLYTYDGTDYQFESARHPVPRYHANYDTYAEIARGPLGDQLYEALSGEMRRAFENEVKAKRRLNLVDYATGYVEGLMRDEG